MYTRRCTHTSTHAPINSNSDVETIRKFRHESIIRMIGWWMFYTCLNLCIWYALAYVGVCVCVPVSVSVSVSGCVFNCIYHVCPQWHARVHGLPTEETHYIASRGMQVGGSHFYSWLWMSSNRGLSNERNCKQRNKIQSSPFSRRMLIHTPPRAYIQACNQDCMLAIYSQSCSYTFACVQSTQCKLITRILQEAVTLSPRFCTSFSASPLRVTIWADMGWLRLVCSFKWARGSEAKKPRVIRVGPHSGVYLPKCIIPGVCPIFSQIPGDFPIFSRIPRFIGSASQNPGVCLCILFFPR